jgi:ABC-type sugar transport system permease subunit/ABC-type glycerol-3-phosphate transport system substrate-binding protein
MRRLGTFLVLLLSAVALAQQPITLRMMAGPAQGMPPKEATDPRSQARRAIFEEFHRRNPDIRIVNAGGLELQGERAESGFLMSMAGSTAPDVFYVNFRQYYNYIDQGFCRPLDDFIAKDPESLSRVHPIIQDVLKSYDGKIYAVPWFNVAIALYYRKDHFLEAGLDPNKPPQNWDEFYRYGQKLVEASPGRSGFAFSAGLGGKGYHWSNFVWQAGGEVVEPTASGVWKSSIATKEAATALDFFRKMTVEKWQAPDGKRVGPMASVSLSYANDIADGKVSMWFAYTNDVVLNMQDLNPALVGIAALPAGPAGRANEINAGMWAINASIKDPKKLEACWRFIKFFSGEEAAKVNAERFIELGMGNLVNPTWLEKFGYEDYLAQVDPAYVAANRALFDTGHPEPYGRNCQQVYLILDNALDRARLEPDTPALEILQDISKEMDRKLLGYTPPEEMERQRSVARAVFGAIVIGVIALLAWQFVRNRGRTDVEIERVPAGTDRRKMWQFMILCLIPAGFSVLVWAYYPLAKGLLIAFQDYRIMKGESYVGLDNFIAVFTQPIFWKSLWNTVIYVGLTILIGFLLPIFLAIALNEIPRGKVLFRTLFYLPAMTSGVVIAFLWRQFYDKGEQGLLNQIVAGPIGMLNSWFKLDWPTNYDWLGDPKLAMLAVVIPGIWAGAGPGSILYLAALKNIPDERYEAADLDGANWRQKIKWIIIPGLKPLILINLLGVFIGSFKAMENVFILTGGGPLYSTHTVGLEVWMNAFMFLKFGYATAAAWVMGAILIGFTLLQIKNLLRMRFSTAKV